MGTTTPRSRSVREIHLRLDHGTGDALDVLANRNKKARTAVIRSLIANAHAGRVVTMHEEERRWLKEMADTDGVSAYAFVRDLLHREWVRRRGRQAAE